MLGAGFVAAFHPDAGKSRVDKEIGGLERVGAVGGGEGGIELADGKIDFGEGVPGLEGVGRGGRGAGELGEGAVGVAEGVVGGGVFDD